VSRAYEAISNCLNPPLEIASLDAPGALPDVEIAHPYFASAVRRQLNRSGVPKISPPNCIVMWPLSEGAGQGPIATRMGYSRGWYTRDASSGMDWRQVKCWFQCSTGPLTILLQKSPVWRTKCACITGAAWCLPGYSEVHSWWIQENRTPLHSGAPWRA